MSAREDEAEKEFARLWRVWRTAHEMCADRGYEISENELNISLEQFRMEHTDANGQPNRRKMCFSARPSDAHVLKHGSSKLGTIWVEFNGEPSVGIKQLRQFGHTITEGNYLTGILITTVNVASAAMKIIPTLLPHVIELFHEQDLLVNITKHELVPKHILLSPEEKKALLERYRVKETQLPRIQMSDPVARYLGLKRGQVVKIIRKSETAGRYASYRWTI